MDASGCTINMDFNSFRTSNKLMNNLKTLLNHGMIGYIKIL